jgi:ribosomal protein S18 acetylase RimI-like enzyme
MEIRRATPSDLPAIMDLEKQSFPEDQRFPEECFLELMDHTTTFIVAVDTTGQVIGYLLGWELGNDEWYLASIATQSRKGAGRKLISTITELHPRILAEVRHENTNGQGFFDHLGWWSARRSRQKAYVVYTNY